MLGKAALGIQIVYVDIRQSADSLAAFTFQETGPRCSGHGQMAVIRCVAVSKSHPMPERQQQGQMLWQLSCIGKMSLQHHPSRNASRPYSTTCRPCNDSLGLTEEQPASGSRGSDCIVEVSTRLETCDPRHTSLSWREASISAVRVSQPC